MIGISILMPIYNGIEFIEESINSVKNQTYNKWELVIGINGHKENSDVFHIANKYSNEKIKILDMYTIKGKSKALNEMVKYCKYDWISLLDVDDIWLPTKLEHQIKYTNEYDVIGTNCKYFGDLNISPKIPLGDITKFNFLSLNPIINSSCLLKKKDAFWKRDIGLNDYELWLRLWKLKKKIFNIHTIEVLHRIHKESAFNSKGNNNLVKELIKNFLNNT